MTELLTARSVADSLGVSSETVLRWTRRGELPALRLPSGALRYRATALEEWLTARELHKDNEAADEAASKSQLTAGMATGGLPPE